MTAYEDYHYAKLEKLDEIKKLDPIDFEHFVGGLFEKMGYQVATTPASGDEGVDLFLEKEGKTSIVQCKRYENQVGQPVVRDLYGVLLHTRAYEAYLVTTGTFSLPAQSWASGKMLHLVDGNELCEWIGIIKPPLPESYLPVMTETKKTEPLRVPSLKSILIGFLLVLFFLALIAQFV